MEMRGILVRLGGDFFVDAEMFFNGGDALKHVGSVKTLIGVPVRSLWNEFETAV